MESLLPFLQGFFLPYNTSVYPGALRFAGHSGLITEVSPSATDSGIVPQESFISA